MPLEKHYSLVPTIFLLTYDALASHAGATFSTSVVKSIQDLGAALSEFRWDSPGSACTLSDLKPLITKVRDAELTLGRFVSLSIKVRLRS